MKRAVPAAPAVPALAELLTALMLAIAMQSIWGVAILWADGLGRALRPPETVLESLVTLRDGTPAVYVRTGRSGVWIYSMRTIEGQPIYGRLDEVVYSGYPILPASLLRSGEIRWPNRVHGWRAKRFDRSGPGECWYSVSDPTGSTRFVGFDIESKQLVGYLGRGGFRAASPPPDERFPLSTAFVNSSFALRNGMTEFEPVARGQDVDSVPLPVPDGVVEVDFLKRQATSVWKGEGAIDVCVLFDSTGLTHQKAGVAFRTRTDVHVVDKDQRTRTAEIPEPMRDKGLYVADIAVDGITLVTSGFEYPSVGYIAKVPAVGPPTVLAVPLANTKPDHSPTWPAVGIAVPQPVGLIAEGLVLTNGEEPYTVSSTWSERLAEQWPLFWPTLLVVVLVSTGLAALAWRRQQRHRLGQELLWAGFVLLFGVPGWLAYRWHRAWPPLEACPHCGATAPRDRETCFRCGKPFPPPKRESFEIRD
jgi:hypothetical protein